MSEINWNNYPTGTFFTCILRNNSCQGRIYKQGSEIFLLQNDHNGSKPEDYETLEFRYSWTVEEGTEDNLISTGVSNLKLIKDPNFVVKEIKNVAKLIRNKDSKLTVRLNDRRNVAVIYTSPFANCQVMTMASAQALRRYSTSELLAIYIALHKYKRVLTIDIEQKHIKAILPRKKDLYLYKTKYINTTGTPMIIAAINLEKMINHLKKKLDLTY